MREPKLSVVIVAYKSGRHLGECMSCLMERNDIGDLLEVVVVDNEVSGATDREHVFRQRFPGEGIHYLKNTRNGGYGQGNNHGIRHAKAPLILVMNPDVRLTGTTPGAICRAFENDSELALLGMRQLLSTGAKGRSFLWAPGLPAGWLGSALLWFSNRFGFFFPHWECIQGSCFAVRKSIFEAAGLFDENVFMYGEERDIHHRIRALGNVRIACDWSQSYRHLTDIREANPKNSEKQWMVAADWCERNGIGATRYWRAQQRHLKAVLAVSRLKAALGRSSESLAATERELDLLAGHLAEKKNEQAK